MGAYTFETKHWEAAFAYQADAHVKAYYESLWVGKGYGAYLKVLGRK